MKIFNKWLYVRIRNVRWIYFLNSFIKSKFLGKKGPFKTYNTELCVEGFPSSGNTYIRYFLSYLAPDIICCHHSHCTANIKSSLAGGIPVIVIIERASSISSTCQADVNNWCTRLIAQAKTGCSTTMSCIRSFIA